MRKIILALAASIGLTPATSFAWWDAGHMQIAAVAYTQLDPPVRDKIAALIRLHPDYAKWTQGLAPADQDKAAFVRSATWADDIKAPAYGYTNDGNTPNGPQASQNIGYADHLMHKYWHYLDIPFSPDGTPLHDPDPVNALTQITTFPATLASGASDDVKSYDLVWLVHLVGDAHQPLHATSRFTHAVPGDAGGNSERIKTTAGKEEALHAFWDGLLGDSSTPAVAITAAASLPAADPIRAVIYDPKVWFEESFAAAQAFAYAPPIGADKGEFTLTPDYEQRAHDVAQRQAAVAGARLAALLNKALR